ncbi:MAG: hypothetical protein UT43_C0046G0010 [Parcubacteria group bacterium GW2011_GWC1_39_29]|nr:MAG: hypothetical protein UT43_C0046G0010 [Parcubacteria group bacterium GW2011_GWC1_39_29]
MWRLIKKWWFLQRLEEAIALHTGKAPIEDILLGRSVLLSQEFFIYGTDKYPGIVFRLLGRFSWLLFWRKHEDPEKLNRRIHEYNNYLKYWLENNYIEMRKIEKNGQTGFMPITTHLADDIHGWFGLIQLTKDKLPAPWMIVTSVVAFLIGLNWGSIWRYIEAIIVKRP